MKKEGTGRYPPSRTSRRLAFVGKPILLCEQAILGGLPDKHYDGREGRRRQRIPELALETVCIPPSGSGQPQKDRRALPPPIRRRDYISRDQMVRAVIVEVFDGTTLRVVGEPEHSRSHREIDSLASAEEDDVFPAPVNRLVANEIGDDLPRNDWEWLCRQLRRLGLCHVRADEQTPDGERGDEEKEPRLHGEALPFVSVGFYQNKPIIPQLY